MSPEALQELLEGPALPRPEGVAPGPLNQGQHRLGYITTISSCVICVIAVAARLTSQYSKAKLGLADALVVCALGFFAGQSYIVYDASIFPGLLVHQWDLQLKHLPRILYYINIASIFYKLIAMCLKIAILIDWLRLFVPTGQRDWVFWTLHGLICVNFVYYASGTMIEIWRCHPREKIWNPLYEGPGSCAIDIRTNYFISDAVNIGSSVAILVLPQWVIWNLHITRRKRMGVSLLFVIGIFACIGAILRLVNLVRGLHSLDVTYYAACIVFWATGEITVGFLILGIPSMPNVARMLPFWNPLVAFIRSLGNSRASETYLKKRTWPKSAARKPPDPWAISGLDTYDLIPTAAASTWRVDGVRVNEDRVGAA